MRAPAPIPGRPPRGPDARIANEAPEFNGSGLGLCGVSDKRKIGREAIAPARQMIRLRAQEVAISAAMTTANTTHNTSPAWSQ
jgi:hypothetical protein